MELEVSEFEHFKQCFKDVFEQAINNEKLLVSQYVTATNCNLSLESFVNELVFILEFMRMLYFNVIMSCLAEPDYVKIKLYDPLIFYYDTTGEEGLATSLISTQIISIIHRAYSKCDAEALVAAFEKLTSLEHPVAIYERELLLDYLHKTLDSVYSASLDGNQLVVTKDIKAITNRNRVIRNGITQIVHAPDSVINALSSVVENAMVIASTLWGGAEKVNPDLVDCHFFGEDAYKHEMGEEFTGKDGNTFKFSPTTKDCEVVFEAHNYSARQWLTDCYHYDEHALLFKKGMTTVIFGGDIYSGIPDPVIKKIGKILNDENVIALINKLLNIEVKDKKLDAKFAAGFGVEICSGANFPVDHNYYKET